MRPLFPFLFLSLALLPGRLWPQPAACPSLGPNLIVNGDFELGYYGFTSDFGRGGNNPTLGNCETQGWILVAETDLFLSPMCRMYPPELSMQYGGPNTLTSPDPNHPSNTSTSTLDICPAPLPNHTPNGRFFLAIDPDGIPGRAYWRQTIPVCPQTRYVFSVWVRNISPGCGLPAPFFHFEVGGVPINAPVSYPGCEWVNTAVDWYSGTVEGMVDIELVNDQPGCIANDVAIDDLFFGVCGGAFLTCPAEFSFCGDSWDAPVTLSGNSYGFADPHFQWQRFDPVSLQWVDLAGATDSLLALPYVTPAEAGRYRLRATSGSSPFSQACSVTTGAVVVGLYPEYPEVSVTAGICRGENYAGYAQPGRYRDTLVSSHGCDSIRLLDLRVYEPAETGISVRTCPGATYLFAGATLGETGVYEAVFSTVDGCDSLVTLSLTVPPADFLGPDTAICAAGSYTLRSPSPQTQWAGGPVGVTLDVTETGVYTAFFVDTAGCVVSDTVRVEFQVAVYVPNVFSPNDDAANDELRPSLSTSDLQAYDWLIFDRWGNLVFRTRDPAEGWRGEQAEAGVYTYVMRLVTGFCGEVWRSGDVTLWR